MGLTRAQWHKMHDLMVGYALVVAVAALISNAVASAPAPTLPKTPAWAALLLPKAVSVPKPFTFPDGGRTLADAYRLVALYGSPDSPALGVLGEQPVAASVDRVKALAGQYRPLSPEPVYPTFEIIATIASGPPTENNDYSRERSLDELTPWVAAAKAAGVYVILDLQPGRSDFLSQAKLYEPLLSQPHVGLALDPEWRLKPDQVHLEQIGSVDISEVNATAAWLAEITKAQKLPQKVFLLHQFRVDMLPNRDQLDIAHPELAYMIQMDGQGSQSAKQGTWQALLQQPPANTAFGWKNFYDEDSPAPLTPEQTMQLTPQPRYISYQ